MHDCEFRLAFRDFLRLFESFKFQKLQEFLEVLYGKDEVFHGKGEILHRKDEILSHGQKVLLL